MLIHYDLEISIEDSKNFELPEDTSVASRISAIFPVSRGSVSIHLINLFETKKGIRKKVVNQNMADHERASKQIMAMSKKPEVGIPEMYTKALERKFELEQLKTKKLRDEIKKGVRKKPSTTIRSLHKKK